MCYYSFFLVQILNPVQDGTIWFSTSVCLKKSTYCFFVCPFLPGHCCLALQAVWRLVDAPFNQQYTGVGEMLLEIYYVTLFSQLVSALFLVELFEPLAE